MVSFSTVEAGKKRYCTAKASDVDKRRATSIVFLYVAGTIHSLLRVKPHKATLPHCSEEALLLWTTRSDLATRAFLEVGAN
jgi:hypothetical protein